MKVLIFNFWNFNFIEKSRGVSAKPGDRSGPPECAAGAEAGPASASAS